MGNNERPTGDEPSQPKKKRKRRPNTKLPDLNNKQLGTISRLTKANTQWAAGRAAGYTTRSAACRGLKRAQRSTPELFASIGVTKRMVAKKIAEMMDRKKVTLIRDGFVIQREYDPDNDIQLRARIHMGKLVGLESPIEVDVNVNHNYRMDFRNAKEEDIDKFLEFCATAFPGGLSSGSGREVSAEPIDVVAG